MTKPKASLLTIVALVLLALAAGVFASLGRWQMSRAAERRVIAAEIDAGRRQTPLELTGRTPTQDLQPWRPAHVAGTWRNDLSLLIDNRNLDGRPGLWLATPLVLADGSAVLVLRGWFARPMMGQTMRQGAHLISTPAGVQSVTGELSAHVPRLFELWSLSGGSSGALPASWSGQAPAQSAITDLDTLIRVQNLDIARLEALSGLKFVPAVLLQKNDPGDGLTRVWPEPSVDSDKNVGYAVQWFGFAGIAVIAALGVALRAWRRRAQTAQ